VSASSISQSDHNIAVSEMQVLMTEITRALVDDAAAVKIDVLNDHEAVILRLHVAPGDIGKVIGKQGRTARSLRTILGAASMKLHCRFSLDIVEAGRPPHESHQGHYSNAHDEQD
jgi:predicted RNA-binding protein YlqC (UPF0109 family)